MHRLLKTIGWFLGKKDTYGYQLRYDEHGKPVHVPAIANYDWSDVNSPVTRKQVAGWVKALRSNKYKQGRSRLCTINKDGSKTYCCLGVFAEVFSTLTDYLDWSGSGFGKFGTMESAAFLTDDVGTVYLPQALQSELATLNDEGEDGFDEIADYLEVEFGLA